MAELETLRAEASAVRGKADAAQPAAPADNPPADAPATPVPDPAPPADTDALPRKADATATDYRAKWEQAQQELDSLKLARLRDRAAHAHGIPLDLSDKLAGTDEATITADAIRLKSYLRTRSAAPPIGGDTPGGNVDQVFSMDQLADPKFYAAHRDAIHRAIAEGRIR